VTRAPATAKINLALVVGPRRDDGKHEVTTVLQRVALADRVEIAAARELRVHGFDGDTLVRDALLALARAAAISTAWHARIVKRIPVAAGLGGGSTDAATALRLANATLPHPLNPSDLHELARGLGADVPFFLANGPRLGEGEGADLSPVDLPQDYFVLLVLPAGGNKTSTAAVYEDFDRREAADGYDQRRAALLETLGRVRRARDLAELPPNDLASSPVADELRALGAFRADVSGAGPVVYGLFHHRAAAERARSALDRRGRSWLTVPAWYG
jgi:4-diphosphocytidyl-2-C-methyl-D-erythritol kinase